MTSPHLSGVAGTVRCLWQGLRLAPLVFSLCGGAAVAATEVAPGCGSLQNAYGPFDYRSQRSKLLIVEKFHFKPETEYLRLNTTTAAGHIDYTLRASPNHHRALMSMMNLAAREKTGKIARATYSVECYLIRAEAFQPDDPTVKVLFGLYLFRNGQPKEGIRKMEAAKQLGSSDPNIPYNVGLAYFDLGMYDKALENAHEAYRLGFQLPGLRNKLERAGKWREAAAGPVVEAQTNEAAAQPPRTPAP